MRYCVQTLSRYDPPPDSIPLRADIRTFDWERLANAQRELQKAYPEVKWQEGQLLNDATEKDIKAFLAP